MIPVQLTIQGLYSYQAKQTINFTRLTASHLFGIFGSVGSGKSSILEAITFAIYGRTDRLNLSGDNRYYNMMNLKSNELLIDFIFETGKEQTAFRATVKGRRNGKNFEEVKSLERSAYQKVQDDWRPIELDALEKAIGLSYENFKRTIIIPQGQFQEFLQLGNKDRTQMMRELFNLGKFEFYYKITSLETKNNAKKQLVEGQLQQLGAVNPEQVKAYQEQLILLENELIKQNEKLAGCRKNEEQLRQLQSLSQRLQEAHELLKELQIQEPGFAELEKKINRYEICITRFKYWLDSIQSYAKKIEEREKQIQFDETKLKKDDEEIASLGKSLEELKPNYEKREELKQRADELELLLRIKELENKVVVEAQRLKNGIEVCEQTLQNIEKLKTEQVKKEERLKTDRAQSPDLALLAKVKAWHVERQGLEKHLQELEKEKAKRLHEENIYRQELANILEEPVFSELTATTEHSVCLQFLKDRTATIREKLKTLDEQVSHLRVKAQLQIFADALEEGKPCPLCGSLHHPERYNTDDYKDAEKQLSQSRQLYEKEVEQMNNLSNRLSLLENQRQFISLQQKELAGKLESRLKESVAHAGRFVWNKYREEAEMEQAFREAELFQNRLKIQESELESLSRSIQQEEKNRERYQAEVEKIKTSFTVHQTELKTLIGQLKLIGTEQYQEVSPEKIGAEREALLRRFNSLEKEFTEKTALLQEHRKLRDTLSGSLLMNRRVMEQDQQALLTHSKKLEEQLSQSSFQTIDEVRSILAEPIALEQEKQKVTAFKDRIMKGKAQLEQLQTEMGDRTYNAEIHDQLKQEMGVLNDQSIQKNQEFGKITELLKKLQNDLESQATLRRELETLEQRAENIRTMKSLFKASGFVNYISSVYLQNLCNAANERFFQLTRQKLSLEITPDNSFQVRDFMNGGKVRSVKTLSGGQTFQAALCLALALADNIQKITESNQNFFFLDEGFGSLDKDSLTVVFDTLKSLRHENRIVGVISHVEEMQQEIEVHLRIENNSDQGSIIHSSWRE